MKNNSIQILKYRGNSRLNVMLALLFAAVLVSLIVYFDDTAPGVHRQAFNSLSQRLEDNAAYANWQWQSQQKPPRIMMVHYDNQDREKSRQPIPMSSAGYPRVNPGDSGCDKLWQQLLDAPMQVEGFRIKGRYIRGDSDNGEAINAYCRFSISTGDRFNYIIRTGEVVR
ncbi:hypothetical protein [Salinimonas chungwhensis]|uniref:hypothetical protein n=1 Tax=Salinimonas chungwhensis TaxID=265425 RepID=UPI00037F1AF4|nr:hypothetical protein [Salinimonas chungwhensis]